MKELEKTFRKINVDKKYFLLYPLTIQVGGYFMNKKLMLSLSLIGAMLTSCGDGTSQKKTEAELNQEAVLLNSMISRHANSLYVYMYFDTNGDYTQPEYFGFSVFETNAISESAVDQYEYEFSQLKQGTKATLKTWSNLIRNIARIKAQKSL